MCYTLRHTQVATDIAEGAPESAPGNLRPRLIAAVAAMLFGGLALAAFVAPQSSPPPPVAKQSAPAPLESKTSAVLPVALDQRSLPADDEVPSNMAKSGSEHCHHGL